MTHRVAGNVHLSASSANTTSVKSLTGAPSAPVTAPAISLARLLTTSSMPVMVSPPLNSTPLSVTSIPLCSTAFKVYPAGRPRMRITREGPESPLRVNVPSAAIAAPALPSGDGPSSAAAAVTRRSPGGRWPSNVTFPLAVGPFRGRHDQIGQVLAIDADRLRRELGVPSAAANPRR